MATASLRPEQIAAMRATADTSLPDEITLFRLERVSDGGGGFLETWVEHETIMGRVGLPLGGETDERSVSRTRLADEDQQTIWMPADTDVRKTDRIIWEGRMFEVSAVRQRGNWEIHRRALVKEL